MITSPLAIRRAVAAAAIAVSAACAPVQAPLPHTPPPAPPAAETVPYRPVPPPQAPYAMDIPRRDANGQRITVNSGLNSNETIWHFRSGWNVAALNCTRPEDAAITDGYRSFLTRYARGLTAANEALDGDYRRSEGSSRAGLLARERHMTSVYNYFASPTARAEFCNTALAVANEMIAAPPADLALFASGSLARYEAAFERFYTAYEEYERGSADWDARYGARFGASQPGYVAVHGGANTLAQAQDQPLTIRSVADPLSGAAIPVVPVDEVNSSMPVVQPLPTGGARR